MHADRVAMGGAEREQRRLVNWGEGARARRAALVKEAGRWLAGLERRLDGREWIACQVFTVADILLATGLREVRNTDLIDPYPRLKA